MTKFKIETVLEKMIGKQFSYNGNAHRFFRFKCDETEFFITTDKSDLNVDNEDAEKFFANCLPIAEDFHLPTTVKAQTAVQQNSSKLSGIIFDNIEKLNKDAGFIPQAQAINEQLKSMVDLGKAEIEMMKLQVMLRK